MQSSENEFMLLYISLFWLFSMCSHDLDNILLENLGDVRTLQAVFELEALLLTGMII
jgi:hypothetical protein